MTIQSTSASLAIAELATRRGTLPSRYVASRLGFVRRVTREVMVGDVGVGLTNPIRVQSMTTTDTMDTEGTVAQALRLVAVGCEIVRITAPTVDDARNIGGRDARFRLSRISTSIRPLQWRLPSMLRR